MQGSDRVQIRRSPAPTDLERWLAGVLDEYLPEVSALHARLAPATPHAAILAGTPQGHGSIVWGAHVVVPAQVARLALTEAMREALESMIASSTPAHECLVLVCDRCGVHTPDNFLAVYRFVGPAVPVTLETFPRPEVVFSFIDPMPRANRRKQ